MFKNKKFRARSRFKNLTHRIETSRVQTTYVKRKNSVRVPENQDDDKDSLLSAEPNNFSRISNKYSVVDSEKFVINIRTLWPAEITMIKPQARKKIFDVGRVGPLPACIQ